ncbi:hypothetical protein BsWGS_17219 [Bradybaena similaris]
MSADKERVLVSGASGFVATHVIKQLQEAGYRVRGTVRNLKDEQKNKHLYNLCPNARHKLELAEADLLNPESWIEAVKGCTYVHHVASPLPVESPKHEEEVIRPAVEGAVNVLKAAAAVGTVKRVVMTSSMVAVAVRGGNKTPFTESDWGDPSDPANMAYSKSKILAERAAWDYVNSLPDNQKFEFAVVNPGFIVGPTLHGSPGTSTYIIEQLLERKMVMCPKLCFPTVDVRDVAMAHLRCMTLPEAVGHRHVIVTRNIWVIEIASVLAKEFRSQGYNVPTRQLPDGLFAFVALFNKMMKAIRLVSAKPFLIDNTRMTQILGINPTDLNKSLIDMGYSMIENGFIKKTSKYRGPSSS